MSLFTLLMTRWILARSLKIFYTGISFDALVHVDVAIRDRIIKGCCF